MGSHQMGISGRCGGRTCARRRHTRRQRRRRRACACATAGMRTGRHGRTRTGRHGRVHANGRSNDCGRCRHRHHRRQSSSTCCCWRGCAGRRCRRCRRPAGHTHTGEAAGGGRTRRGCWRWRTGEAEGGGRTVRQCHAHQELFYCRVLRGGGDGGQAWSGRRPRRAREGFGGGGGGGRFGGDHTQGWQHPCGVVWHERRHERPRMGTIECALHFQRCDGWLTRILEHVTLQWVQVVDAGDHVVPSFVKGLLGGCLASLVSLLGRKRVDFHFIVLSFRHRVGRRAQPQHRAAERHLLHDGILCHDCAFARRECAHPRLIDGSRRRREILLLCASTRVGVASRGRRRRVHSTA